MVFFDNLPTLVRPLGVGAIMSLVIALFLSKRFANTLTAPISGYYDTGYKNEGLS